MIKIPTNRLDQVPSATRDLKNILKSFQHFFFSGYTSNWVILNLPYDSVLS